ncbi:MAG: spore cortex biosynthesis protein YabQ [Bacillota bacterium]
MQDLTSQFYAFCVTVLTGLLLGIFFDVYRVVRGIIRPRRIISHLSDLLFWLISTGFIFLLLLFGNWGEVRLYVFIGVGLGAFIYLQLFSRLTVKLLVFLLRLLGYVKNLVITCLYYIIIIILFPFRLVKNVIIIPVGFIGTAVMALHKRLSRMFRRLIGIPVKRGWRRIKRRLRKIFSIF